MGNAHGYDTKVFPLTPAQGRVLFHVERVFRSTGTHFKAYADFLERAAAIVANRTRADTWSGTECALLHHAVVAACRRYNLHLFRDVAP